MPASMGDRLRAMSALRAMGCRCVLVVRPDGETIDAEEPKPECPVHGTPDPA